MPGKVLGENVTFRIEVEDSPRRILLVFDKKCDTAVVPWEDAFNLANVMEQVISDVGGDWPRSWADNLTPHAESNQIKLNHGKGLVYLFVGWTDRLVFTTIEGFFLVMRALRHVAQDAHLELRGTRFRYNRQGGLKEVHNVKDGTHLTIPGR